MKNFINDSSRLKLFNNLIVILISVYGVTQHRYSLNRTSWFERTMIELFAPLQRGTLSMKEKVAYFFDHYIMIVDTSKQNEELRKKLDEMDNEIFRLEEVQKENSRLKQLLQFGKDIPRKKVLAQVVGWDSSNEFKVLRINKGRSDGIKLMSPVITMTGLVGYVYRVTNNYSDILTILDQNNRVDAIVARTRSHGIVEGVSGFKCRLKYVIRTQEVQVGDEVLTAGLGQIYPKGIRVGTITDIDKENYGITQAIELTPAVDFNRLEEVVVLLEEELASNEVKSVEIKTNGKKEDSPDEI